MRKSLSLVIIAILAFGIGIAYAAPMLILPNNQLYPHVIEGPKAQFNIDVVYANLTRTDLQPAASGTGINYEIVLNITNTADTPATLYQTMFAAAQNVTVRDSILGGSMYSRNSGPGTGTLGGYIHFGGVVEGVRLDGKWVNTTWIPNFYDEINGTLTQVHYPLCLYRITQTLWSAGLISGPLIPEDVAAFSANHAINGTIPKLPSNAENTGIWFEGVPITEYYDNVGNPILTEMYINGAWVDVTGRVIVDQPQPMLTASNTIVNQVLPLGASPYQNMNSTIGPVTTLPTWGDWGVGGTYCLPQWQWASQSFNNTFAPHESRLIVISNSQATRSFALHPSGLVVVSYPQITFNLAALESGNITIYASASNYITNEPINGTYLNTVSTTIQIKPIQLQQTSDGYLYNTILADNQTFQQINPLEVTIATRTEP